VTLETEAGRSHGIAPSLWLVRIETDGNGGLIETPVRPCTREERRRVEARIEARMAAGAPEPAPTTPAAPIPDLTDSVVALIERDGYTTRPAIEAELGATSSQAFTALARLRDAGRVRLEGRGVSARYVSTAHRPAL
jgi:hypothetical protein